MTAVRARSLALDIVPVIAFAALSALAAQVTIPFWPVPFTLQTFTVLTSGVLLGARRGATSQAAYLAAGAAGLPVFAAGHLGAGVLLGDTAGYLWAFAPAAFLAGLAAERWQGWRLGLALSVLSLVVLAVGASWLSRWIGSAAWVAGFLLFIPSEALKVVAATALSRAYDRSRR